MSLNSRTQTTGYRTFLGLRLGNRYSGTSLRSHWVSIHGFNRLRCRAVCRRDVGFHSSHWRLRSAMPSDSCSLHLASPLDGTSGTPWQSQRQLSRPLRQLWSNFGTTVLILPFGTRSSSLSSWLSISGAWRSMARYVPTQTPCGLFSHSF
jgi:hypothetical protein